MRQSIVPESEAAWLSLRTLDVTSTESSALFGMSPYSTAFEVWHNKRSGELCGIKDNERMFWGRKLQDAIADGIAEQQGWVCEPMREYARIVDSRMGSSFDYRMIDESNRIGVFEIKNVDYLAFRDKWTINDDKSIEAPPHIEIQLQHQMHVAGYEWGAIGVLVGGNTPHVLVRERDEAVGRSIEKRISEFWASIEANREPAPIMPDDAQFMATLYGYAEPGKLMDARGDATIATLCAEYAAAGKREKQAKEDKDIAKAKLLSLIGDAEKVLVDGFSISAGLVGPCEVSYTRDGYRNFRVTTKKEKQ